MSKSSHKVNIGSTSEKPQMYDYWVSCQKFTVCVTVDQNNIIRVPAPIVKKFKGQPLSNLMNWCRKFGKKVACVKLPA